MYGDGSDGALNVTSGAHILAPDVKHQFTTVNVGPAGTILSASGPGSVLYIAATESINIDGMINTFGRAPAGNNSWSVTIDGVTYTSPGVAAGGKGGNGLNGGNGGNQGLGFGGGGAGGGWGTAANSYRGGHGGNGGFPGGNGGSPVSRNTTSNIVSANGAAGGASAGGSGGIVVIYGSYSSGRGGNAYGSDGASGGGSSSTRVAGGGGGAGGSAGSAGLHVVLSAPVVTINGTIITSGTNGQKGGNGGANSFSSNSRGSGGGGGGGGNAGNIYIYHGGDFNQSGSLTMAGGQGGLGGSGYQSGTAGTNGASGTTSIVAILEPSDSASSVSSTSPEARYNAPVSPAGSNIETFANRANIIYGGITPVNVTSYGGGFGSVTGWGVVGYAETSRPSAEIRTLTPVSSLHETFSSSPSISEHPILYPGSAAQQVSSNPAFLLIQHAILDPQSAEISLTGSEPGIEVFTLLFADNTSHGLFDSSVRVSQLSEIKPSDSLTAIYSSTARILNLTDLGYDFGRYRPGYGASGQLEGTDKDTGRIRDGYKFIGTLEKAEPGPGGRYREQYKQDGDF